ncbi:hypothetical protein [Actinoplanes auranticolor]|uniref:hypothetical protein n=1 Tax=Actinoplanes auranticolor TaxID=47988 RepID=UPI001BB35E98|nr:hypothetical protein [Actinoplanes auranticolor]
MRAQPGGGVELPGDLPGREGHPAVWLHGQLRRLADELTTPAAIRMTTSLVQRDAADDGALHQRRDRLFGVLEDRLAAVLCRAGRPAARPTRSPRH